ncbi:glycerophosphoryl diester phosphodiesterase membrane domain-containing protein [Arthrobacter sp. SX1312]|uniref:glycerophosphoryl diester phosphodiesterase membrane domain-containing protein n=1 Tax=Arthrobacter sp. SX1312 TaxID=2058896 RepID=UPI0011B034D5|nr:glycerophosphoryl diester phosphodiesterase membrane domain-containing protein [Arthrobacter sp. SX1312]
MKDQAEGQPDGGRSGDGPLPDQSPDRTPPQPQDEPQDQAQQRPAPWQAPTPGDPPWQSPGRNTPVAPSWGTQQAGPTAPADPWGHPPGPSPTGGRGYQGPPPGSGFLPARPGPAAGSQGWGDAYPPQGPWQGGPGFARAPGYQAPPKPGVIPLRPLGLGEILDGAFQACRKNPLATFGIAILLQAVVALVTVLLLGNVLSSLEVFESANPTPDSLVGAFAGLGVFAAVAGVVSAAALLVLQGILVIPIARAVINQATTFGQAWRLARRRILPLLAFGLLAFAAGLAGLAVLVGISALAILGLEEYSALVIVPLVLGALAALVWVSTKLVVAPAALMLEGVGPWTAVRRSWQLTRGNWWRTFGIVLLTSIIVSIITSVISAPLSFAVTLFFGFSTSASATPDAMESLPVLAASQAITALVTAVGYAFQAGVTSLLYVDLRMRREGFDVVLMRDHEQAGPGRTDILPGGTTSFGHQPDGPA